MHETAGYRMSDRRAEVAESRTKKGGVVFSFGQIRAAVELFNP